MAETKSDPWEDLRKPFPAERVLKLPATNKRPELDYVSHADVTDRLLQVDPEWSWEWGVDDPATGRPSKELSLTREDRVLRDREGQEFTHSEWALWMALKVNGVTKRDVGYAPADKDEVLKHVVSDALRRCAMRFGVALDLWMKDDTEAPAAAHSAGPVVGCPQCGKPLRERNGSKGPFVGCSGYPACKFTANGTLDQFQGMADAPPDDEPGQHPSDGATRGAQIAALVNGMAQNDIRDAFKAAGASDCLAAVGSGWKIRGADVARLSADVWAALVQALSGDVDPDEIPFP